MAWDKELPAGNAPLRDGDDNIRANNAAIESALGADHEFSAGGTNSGKHKKLTLEEQSGDQTVAANEMGLYAKDDSGAPALYCRPESDGSVIKVISKTGNIIPPVDDTTIELSSENLQVKDGGISAAKLATDAVETAKIKDANVTLAKLHADAVVTEAEGIDSNDNDTSVPTSAAVKDKIDTDVATKEDTIVSQATASLFGAWTANDTTPAALDKTHVYQAQCDGLLIVRTDEAQAAGLFGYTDGSNPPTTLRIKQEDAVSGYVRLSMTLPVRKDDYVKVTCNAALQSMYWLPFGTGGLVKQ